MDSPARPPLHRLPDGEVERLLATGERRAELVAAFGARGYAELAPLARQAARLRRRGGPVVYVLPGLMGSRLGTRGRLVDDVVWLDPFEVAAGHLTRLALPRGAALVALGAMLMNTLKLKLSLEIAGFDVRLHPYDWRLDPPAIAAALLARVEREGADGAMLVGHSLGGVVARQALAADGDRIRRIVQLGAPNHGSYAAVLAMRGVYPTVRKLAALDLRHDAEDLSRVVFRTLPSLYRLLPTGPATGGLDFLDPESWPDDRLRPDRQLLAAALQAPRAVGADPRCLCIVGLGQRTVLGAARDGDAFRYRTGSDGDGTVPRELAEIDGCPTWYVAEKHGGLPNNGPVIAAVGDLLRDGATNRLPSAARVRRDARARWVTEEALRRVAPRKLGWMGLSPDARRRLLEPVVSPEFHGRVPAAALAVRPRRRPAARHPAPPTRRLELRLMRGSIADANARALVLGVFQDVDPSGAARTVDRRLDGAVREFTLRRMISGRLGEAFVLPCAQGRLIADFVLFAGLGPCAAFDAAAHAVAADNAVRTLVRAGVADFATVLFGAGSGVPTVAALERQLAGMLAALREADPSGVVRRITLCEIDRARGATLQRALPRLAARLSTVALEVAYDEAATDAAGDRRTKARAAPPEAVGATEPDPAWLFVSMQPAGRAAWDCSSSLLTAGAKAAVLSGTVRIGGPALRELLARARPERLAARELARYGHELAHTLLAGPVREGLGHTLRRPLVIVHDREASRVPWEVLRIGDAHPALTTGLSRRYRSDGLSVARWRAERAVGARPQVLVVANPTGDLPGADVEGRRLRAALAQRGLAVRSVVGDDASRAAVLAATGSADCDVLHFAGHGHFDEDDPGASGLVCAHGEVLRGADLAGLDSLPPLVFFNACEAARVRARGASQQSRLRRVRRSGSVAEAMLDGGVANFIGTHWPVGDDAALGFATHLYASLADGAMLGEAVLGARRALQSSGSVDWADYVHYGNPRFLLVGRAAR